MRGKPEKICAGEQNTNVRAPREQLTGERSNHKTTSRRAYVAPPSARFGSFSLRQRDVTVRGVAIRCGAVRFVTFVT